MSERAILRADHLPRKTVGRHSPLFWAMMVFTAIELAVFIALYSSYLYIRVGVPEWPMDGIAPPDLLWPSLASLPFLASAGPVWWAHRGIRTGDRRRLMLGVLLGMALAGAALALLAIDYAGLPFGPSTNAYGSLFWTIGGVHIAHVAALLCLAAGVLLLTWRGHFTAERTGGVECMAIFWYLVVALWVPTFATLYVAPYVL